ncbi:hypothetical protein CMK14_12970 [Candidatus Poribacteria bacterium]|nr:hypothetical protein [Candidatus Poribacteria bacterium]
MSLQKNVISSILLIPCLILLSSTTNSNPIQVKALADYPNQLTRDGELIILPDQGTVYLGTDFHGKLDCFEQWLKQTALIEQIDSGQDVYGLILGDVLDHKLTESIPDPESDTKIVDQIRRLQQKLGVRGKRLIYLKGNHELAATGIYAMLKKNGMDDSNREHLIDSLYRSAQGSYFQQFNAIERITDEQYEYLANLPVIAVGKRGMVAVHAGISPSALNISDLVHPSQTVLDQLLWGRPSVAMANGYTTSQTQAFLKKIGGTFLISGHTPLNYLPAKGIKNGVSLLDKGQLIFSTGYGAEPGVLSYLAIDLSQTYTSVSELKHKVEIHPLFPSGK